MLLATAVTACSVDGAVSAAPQSCHESVDPVAKVRAWRAHVVVLLDELYGVPEGLGERLARLEEAMRSGDFDRDGELDFAPLVEARVDVARTRFDAPLEELLRPRLDLGYSRYDLRAAVLVTTGDPRPAIFEGVTDLVRRVPLTLVLAGGVPPEHVRDGWLDAEMVLSDPRMHRSEPLCSLPDGAAVSPSPNLVRLYRSAALAEELRVVSLCEPAFGEQIEGAVLERAFDRILPGLCFPRPEADSGDGRLACTMYEIPPDESPYDCEDLPGRTPAPTAEEPRRCRVVQRVPPAIGEPDQPGWFADRTSPTWEDLCGHDVLTNFARRSHPLPGTRAWLECLRCTPIVPDASALDGGR